MDPIKELLTQRVAEVIELGHLEEALRTGKNLRIKFGIDPTSPDVHLGHTVPLLKLREFQRLGHQIILIIGDYTATIGDPTGKSSTRKPLTKEEVKENMKTYKEQILKILDQKKTEFIYNSRWFERMSVSEMIQMAATATLQQVKKRGDFRKRLESGGDVTLPEFIYPVMQGYDSVQVKADVEVGGTDQKFNLLMGRQVQKRFGQKEQDILTVPLLIGTDGNEKMSKTAGNFIGIQENAEEMFGKIMSIPDKLVISYLELITELPTEEVARLKKRFDKEPLEVKKILAYEVAKMYHGEDSAQKAAQNFTAAFSKGEVSEDTPTWNLANKNVDLANLLVEKGIFKSKSDVRRLIKQGGIQLNGEKLTSLEVTLKEGVLKIGKKTFIKIK